MVRPVFSLVSAVHGVAEELPAFLASLDGQSFDHRRFEVVVVIDGVVDASPEIIRGWRGRTDIPVRVVEQENAGVAAARNAGLALARGRWVSFPDPDDLLTPGYLAEVDRRRRAAGWRPPEFFLARTEITDGSETWPHPLDWRFGDGSGVIALDGDHDFINLTTNCCFLRADVVPRSGMRFRSDVRPSFEDAVFFAEVALSCPHPRVGICAEAVYRYRKRSSGGSLVQRGWRDPARFTTLLENGYLRLLTRARGVRGRVPRWCQDAVLYDLGWVFYSEARGRLDPSLFAGQTGLRFRALCGEVAQELDLQQIVATRQTTCEAAGKVALALTRPDVDRAAIVQDGAVVEVFRAESAPGGADLTVGGLAWATRVADADASTDPVCRIPRWVGRPRSGLVRDG